MAGYRVPVVVEVIVERVTNVAMGAALGTITGFEETTSLASMPRPRSRCPTGGAIGGGRPGSPTAASQGMWTAAHVAPAFVVFISPLP
jgi:hypothetical protein